MSTFRALIAEGSADRYVTHFKDFTADALPPGDVKVEVFYSSLNYKASGKTDANGEMSIEITRSGATYDPTTPVRAMVRVSFGLVSQSVGVVL